ncbi:hypothetical protein T440DRAFT_469782 [Plenodomus tracheiphilus IPT5]|uniref:Uncharacterized protein n=1 Tax=Plenodomus tracheiphilus IPT5 TaxID=1408161 RepID=A0A6A7B0I2_9PLEO|nr:hypothetical protein T440DRAFT_469782 [Plenodomus tracheiphilus IPT5]
MLLKDKHTHARQHRYMCRLPSASRRTPNPRGRGCDCVAQGRRGAVGQSEYGGVGWF